MWKRRRILYYIEAKRRGDTPKQTVLEQLAPYANDPQVFVRFVDKIVSKSNKEGIDKDTNNRAPYVPKLGVRPDTNKNYNTPTGLCFYPIAWVIQQLERKDKVFKHDAPYIFVVKLTTDKVLRLQDYTRQQYVRDKLRLRELAYELRHHFPEKTFAIDEDFKQARIDAKTKNYTGNLGWGVEVFWAAHNLAKTVGGTTVSRWPIEWVKILQELGYQAVLDQGDGIIHENEPVQLIVFKRQDVKVLTVISNKTQAIPTLTIRTYLKYAGPRQDLTELIDLNFTKLGTYTPKFWKNVTLDMLYHLIEVEPPAQFFAHCSALFSIVFDNMTPAQRVDIDWIAVYKHAINYCEPLSIKVDGLQNIAKMLYTRFARCKIFKNISEADLDKLVKGIGVS